MDREKFPKQFFIGLLTSVFVFTIFTIFTAIPWAFIYVEIGRCFGPYFGLALASLTLIGIFASTSIISYNVLSRLKKATTRCIILTNFITTLLISLLLSLIFIQRVSEADQKIAAFVAQNKSLNFPEYVASISSFLNVNIKNAYRKPEDLFKIDNHIYSTPLGAYLTQKFGITRASIIVYQGWGTCGQAAILIEELLARAGYETRQAHFKNIDHAWAEVKYNETWLIIDPWYIGNLIEIQNLKTLRPQFQNATGVIVQYRNGTTTDASQEHGYLP